MLFTLYPEISPNVLISCNTAGIDLLKFDMNRITSSAYKHILCSVGPIVIPQKC